MISCHKCGAKHYRGEPCPACFHDALERKAVNANQNAKGCPKCGTKFNYLLVCNRFNIKLRPECNCWAKPTMGDSEKLGEKRLETL